MKRKTFAAVTSQQVAQLAGVSQSAVSRTFTPGASISPATREKVLKAARELGYRPNAIARSLNTARSRIIGVVISYFDNPFYSQVLEALAQKLDTLNYHLLLFVGDREGNVDRIFDQIMQYRVDGIVLASVTLSLELSEECLAAGIPVVLFNRSEESGMASSVNSNNEAAARQIAEFLLAGEHKRFAYVGGVADSPVNIARQRGFISTLEAYMKDAETKFNWGIVKYPHPAGAEAGSTLGTVTSLAINADSPKAEAAADFINWCVSEEGAQAIAKTGTFPACGSAATAEIIKSTEGFPEDSNSVDALTTSNVYLEMPYTQYASDIETILNAEHDAIMTMSETVDEGIQNMNDQVPAVLG